MYYYDMPELSGWYWYWGNDDQRPRIVRLDTHSGTVYTVNTGTYSLPQWQSEGPGLWYGPLKAPDGLAWRVRELRMPRIPQESKKQYETP